MELKWILMASIGLLLMLAEIVLPGGVAFAMGFSLWLLVGLMIQGVEVNLIDGFLYWSICTFCIVFLFAFLSRKFWKGDEEVKDLIAHGEWHDAVEVLEEVSSEKGGRIFFQGTSWSAISKEEICPKGSKVRILAQENVSFLVEKHS